MIILLLFAVYKTRPLSWRGRGQEKAIKLKKRKLVFTNQGLGGGGLLNFLVYPLPIPPTSLYHCSLIYAYFNFIIMYFASNLIYGFNA